MVSNEKESDEKKRPATRVSATVSGFAAWALETLAAEKHQTVADIGGYVLERWVDDNHEYLAKYGITRERCNLELAENVRGFTPGGRK